MPIPASKSKMIELYCWPTPNGHKILFLGEAGLPYTIKRVDLGKGEQHAPEYQRMAPNSGMPAIIDHAPADGGAPISVFASGAILLYLADKSRQFIQVDARGRVACMKWLFWPVAGLGPKARQSEHFKLHATQKIPYAIERCTRETTRLYGVLNRHLDDREYICGEEYSIADIACYPWIVPYAEYSQKLENFPHLQRWSETMRVRPAISASGRRS
ncbi:MAG: glutathione binding-like protein [Rudaea sp.]